MLELLRDTWTRAQSALRTRAGDAAYEAWLSGLHPLALERGICYLEAKSRLICERVERLYQPLIEDVLTDEFGTRISVTVVPAPDALVPDRIEVGPTRPVIDESNRSAFLVLSALAEQRELPSSLFYFHGPPGAGKTFLLRWWAQSDEREVRWYDGAHLTKVFQACQRDRRVAELRQELVDAPTLLLDEVHRISGYRRLQRELGQVLEARAAEGRETLMASRWHPHQIWRFEEGLASRMLSGLVTRVDQPGPQARLTYLRALEGPRSRNGRAPEIESLAQRVNGGYEEVRRAWLMQRDAHPIQGRYLKLIDPGQTFRKMCERVGSRLDVTREDLLGKSQGRRVSFARQVLAYLCVQDGLSRAEVGRYMGGRSRASVSYMTKRLEQRMADSADVRRQVEGLL